ncbi:Gldg family protein [Sphingomonas segetis]|uniref:Gldg family protein n=1 Tax=Sphingomonas segetis TaxID=1104779 RepID=UPI0012D2D39D|nr:hypothetical protein [Sphingomonas segetis]
MRVARGRALLTAGVLFIVAVALAVMLARRATDRPPPRPAAERPTLLVLTGLPLMFGEDFSVERNGSPALDALEKRYRVIPISVTDPAELAKGRLLMMAQPRAQPAEDLVALDAWVRGGGRVLLLADPMLEWPSERPLGDPLRAPRMFMDTGLLAHWGLRLDAPDERGASVLKLGGFDVLTVSPGQLSGGCDISPDRLVAQCRIGKGQASVVADADLLDADRLGSSAARNLDGLLAELESIEHRRFAKQQTYPQGRG